MTTYCARCGKATAVSCNPVDLNIARIDWCDCPPVAVSPLADHVAALRKALREDPELWRTWRANIAMAFYDGANGEAIRSTTDLHRVANEGAERFLQQLCSGD